MTVELIYTFASVVLVGIGLYALIVRRHMIRRLLAANIMGSGVFVLLMAMAARGERTDPVPQAMVLTGIVVAVSATAVGLVLIRRIVHLTGSTHLDPGDEAREYEEPR